MHSTYLPVRLWVLGSHQERCTQNMDHNRQNHFCFWVCCQSWSLNAFTYQCRWIVCGSVCAGLCSKRMLSVREWKADCWPAVFAQHVCDAWRSCRELLAPQLVCLLLMSQGEDCFLDTLALCTSVWMAAGRPTSLTVYGECRASSHVGRPRRQR